MSDRLRVLYGHREIPSWLHLTYETFYVICYATSWLNVVVEIGDGQYTRPTLPSEIFLKSIRFDLSADPANQISLAYNKSGLELWPNTTFTDDQVNAW